MLSAANSGAEWNSFTTASAATRTSTGHSKFIAAVAATKEMQSIAAEPTWPLIRKQDGCAAFRPADNASNIFIHRHIYEHGEIDILYG
jgi:hypothetical protein